MSLRGEKFKLEYRTGEHNIVEELYHRALDHATEYRRAVGFFSSSALESIGAPLGKFIVRGGTMLLITSVRLSAEDAVAIQSGMDRGEVCEKRLLQEIEDAFKTPFGKGTFLLTTLLAAGRLTIRIALPRSGSGIYHEKVGIFRDSDGHYLTFSGSSNESRSAFETNYECIDVFPSWTDAVRAEAKWNHFERLWKGEAQGVETLPFPEAARRALLVKHTETASLNSNRGRDSGDREALWDHQREAAEAFLKAKRGILEMATGTGKTRTALHICRHLLNEGIIDTIVVAADGTDLLDQWYLQLLSLAKDSARQISILRHYGPYHERDHFEVRHGTTALLSSRQALAPALRSLSTHDAQRTLLIHDEVHRLGSAGNRISLSGLSDLIAFRLGLSATPERDYDSDGNAFIQSHIGSVLYRYELQHAIRDRILAPFNYFPLLYMPDESDRLRLQSVYKRAAAQRHAGNPMSKEEVWIELAKVYKTSLAKLHPFADFLLCHSDLLRRCIIFVETREYGDEVLDLIHRYRHDFHTYYAEEDAGTLQRFATGNLECLVTCHRLSEGIDIRSLETVILFSSSRTRLETIQRIGRCLRIDPGNPSKRANVIDFIRTGEENGEQDNAVGSTNPDVERQQWLQELSKIAPRSASHGS